MICLLGTVGSDDSLLCLDGDLFFGGEAFLELRWPNPGSRFAFYGNHRSMWIDGRSPQSGPSLDLVW